MLKIYRAKLDYKLTSGQSLLRNVWNGVPKLIMMLEDVAADGDVGL